MLQVFIWLALGKTQKEVKSMQKKTAKLYKKGAAKSLSVKSCEIKGGGHEMAAMLLMIRNFNNAQRLLLIHIIAAISWPPPLISQPFHPGFLKAAPFLYSLAVLHGL